MIETTELDAWQNLQKICEDWQMWLITAKYEVSHSESLEEDLNILIHLSTSCVEALSSNDLSSSKLNAHIDKNTDTFFLAYEKVAAKMKELEIELENSRESNF